MGILWKLVLVVGLFAPGSGSDLLKQKVIDLDASQVRVDAAMDFPVGSVADQIGLIGVVPFFTRFVALVVDRNEEYSANFAFLPSSGLVPRQITFGDTFPVFEGLRVARYEYFLAGATLSRETSQAFSYLLEFHRGGPNQIPADADVSGSHRALVGQMDLSFKPERSAPWLQDGWIDRNRHPRPLSLTRNFIRLSHSLRRFAGIFNGFTSEMDLPEQASGSKRSNEGANHRPYCSVLSGVCGLPLGAKIALTPILALLAWICQDRFLDSWWALGRDRMGRKLVHNRRRALGWFTLSMLFFAAVFAVWLWGSTDA